METHKGWVNNTFTDYQIQRASEAILLVQSLQKIMDHSWLQRNCSYHEGTKQKDSFMQDFFMVYIP
jgi:hypothetical protein